MEIISKYFPNLTDIQKSQFASLSALYKEWNDQINVISRKDVDNLYTRHVLHSLAIAKYIKFKDGTKLMDLGTGGGFPAIPLAIIFPEIEVHAIDGTAKKIKVLNEISEAIKLKNIKGQQLRAEENKSQYDFIVTRAVTSLDKLILWSDKLILKKQINATPNGLIALKGSTPLKEEMKGIKKYMEKVPLSNYFEEEFFEEKSLVYVQL